MLQCDVYHAWVEPGFDSEPLLAMMIGEEGVMRLLDADHLDGSEAGIVKKSGRVVGCFFPFSSHSLPKELRRHIAYCLSDNVAANMRARGVTEDEVLESLK